MNVYTMLKTVFTGMVLLTINGFAIASEKWVACGDDQLRFYEINDNSVREVERLSWSEITVPGPFSDIKNLNGIVECKPVNNGRDLLVTSWLGGVARLNLSEKVVNFSANVPHAHSAELLPNDRIVVVGNYLRIFDDKNGKTPLIQLRLDDGHGVSWDASRNTLYVLSEDFIDEFELQKWDTSAPELKAVAKTKLPGQSDGHDLIIAPNGSLLVSTRDGVWNFNPDSRKFTPHAGLNSIRRAQSIAEVGSYLAWVQAEESWWGKGFFVKFGDNQAQRVETPELKMYKVRNIP